MKLSIKSPEIKLLKQFEIPSVPIIALIKTANGNSTKSFKTLNDITGKSQTKNMYTFILSRLAGNKLNLKMKPSVLLINTVLMWQYVVKQMDWESTTKYEASVDLNDFVNRHCSRNNSFSVLYITTNEILKYLNTIGTGKAAGTNVFRLATPSVA